MIKTQEIVNLINNVKTTTTDNNNSELQSSKTMVLPLNYKPQELKSYLQSVFPTTKSKPRDKESSNNKEIVIPDFLSICQNNKRELIDQTPIIDINIGTFPGSLATILGYTTTISKDNNICL